MGTGRRDIISLPVRFWTTRGRDELDGTDHEGPEHQAKYNSAAPGTKFTRRMHPDPGNVMVVEFTKSRPDRSTDNALVEGKNGAVVRKHMGYGMIGSEWADSIHDFYIEYLNPYLNFHRPCGFATIKINESGKRRRTYPHDDYRTPFEKLTSLTRWTRYLKPGITAKSLRQFATWYSDTEATTLMQDAKIALLNQARSRRLFADCTRMNLTPYQSKYFAREVTKRCASDRSRGALPMPATQGKQGLFEGEEEE